MMTPAGKLLYWIHQALGPQVPAHFVAIERSSFARTHSNYSDAVTHERLKIDIEVCV